MSKEYSSQKFQSVDHHIIDSLNIVHESKEAVQRIVKLQNEELNEIVGQSALNNKTHTIRKLAKGEDEFDLSEDEKYLELKHVRSSDGKGHWEITGGSNRVYTSIILSLLILINISIIFIL